MASLRASRASTNFMAFYDRVTALVDKGGTTDVIYLDLNKAFDLVPHNILVSKLDRYRFDRWTTQWIWNWLDGHTQRFAVNGSTSKWRPVTSGVTQRSDRYRLTFLLDPMDSGIVHILSKFADNTKLCGVRSTGWREGMPSRGSCIGLRGGPI